MTMGRRRFRALAGMADSGRRWSPARRCSSMSGFHPPDDGHDDHGHGSGPRALLETPVESLAAAEIIMGDALWRFERDPAGAWTHGAAGDPEGRIAAALGVLGRARIVRELPAARDVERYGVAAPQLSLALRPHGADTPARYVFGDLAARWTQPLRPGGGRVAGGDGPGNITPITSSASSGVSSRVSAAPRRAVASRGRRPTAPNNSASMIAAPTATGQRNPTQSDAGAHRHRTDRRTAAEQQAVEAQHPRPHGAGDRQLDEGQPTDAADDLRRAAQGDGGAAAAAASEPAAENPSSATVDTAIASKHSRARPFWSPARMASATAPTVAPTPKVAVSVASGVCAAAEDSVRETGQQFGHRADEDRRSEHQAEEDADAGVAGGVAQPVAMDRNIDRPSEGRASVASGVRFQHPQNGKEGEETQGVDGEGGSDAEADDERAAIAGPTKRARLNTAELIATAEGRSARGTRLGTSASRAGWLKPTTVPPNSASGEESPDADSSRSPSARTTPAPGTAAGSGRRG